MFIGVNLYTYFWGGPRPPPNVEFAPPPITDIDFIDNCGILVGNDTQWRIIFSLNSNLLIFPLSTDALTYLSDRHHRWRIVWNCRCRHMAVVHLVPNPILVPNPRGGRPSRPSRRCDPLCWAWKEVSCAEPERRYKVFCAEPQRRLSILATDSFEKAFLTELESRPSVTNHGGIPP